MLNSTSNLLKKFVLQEQNYFNKKGSQRFDFIDKIHHLCLDSSLSQMQELNSAITATPADGQKLVEQAVVLVVLVDLMADLLCLLFL